MKVYMYIICIIVEKYNVASMRRRGGSLVIILSIMYLCMYTSNAFVNVQSNLLFADGSSLELAGKDPGAGGGADVASLAAPPHDSRMEAAPHAPMDDGFGGTIGDVGDFGRK
jgi:hypothetical protein